MDKCAFLLDKSDIGRSIRLCTALTDIECDGKNFKGCKFYKTVAMLENERKNSTVRLMNLGIAVDPQYLPKR